jgi:hypothetical protein
MADISTADELPDRGPMSMELMKDRYENVEPKADENMMTAPICSKITFDRPEPVLLSDLELTAAVSKPKNDPKKRPRAVSFTVKNDGFKRTATTAKVLRAPAPPFPPVGLPDGIGNASLAVKTLSDAPVYEKTLSEKNPSEKTLEVPTLKYPTLDTSLPELSEKNPSEKTLSEKNPSEKTLEVPTLEDPTLEKIITDIDSGKTEDPTLKTFPDKTLRKKTLSSDVSEVIHLDSEELEILADVAASKTLAGGALDPAWLLPANVDNKLVPVTQLVPPGASEAPMEADSKVLPVFTSEQKAIPMVASADTMEVDYEVAPELTSEKETIFTSVTDSE